MPNIRDYLGNEYKVLECLGCEITKKGIIAPGGVVYESDALIMSGDPEIPIRGFLVINSKRHINSLTKMTKEERAELIELVAKSIKVIKELGLATRVTVLQEERSQHFHVWIFPMQDWMKNKYGEGLAHIREICEDVRENTDATGRRKVVEAVEEIKKYFSESEKHDKI